MLAAYDPERGRAVVSQLAADSGIIASLRLIDLLERRESTTLSVTIAGLAPVAGVGTLALPEGAPLADRLLLLDLASGESRERLRWPPGGSLGRPLWSADGRLLAIAGYTDDADGGETAILVLDPAATDAAPDRRWFVPGGGAPLAFSPDSRWLLTQAGAADEAFGSRLMLLPLAGGDPLVAPLTVPPGTTAASAFRKAWASGLLKSVTPSPVYSVKQASVTGPVGASARTFTVALPSSMACGVRLAWIGAGPRDAAAIISPAAMPRSFR